jgi:hypothetical protein
MGESGGGGEQAGGAGSRGQAHLGTPVLQGLQGRRKEGRVRRGEVIRRGLSKASGWGCLWEAEAGTYEAGGRLEAEEREEGGPIPGLGGLADRHLTPAGQDRVLGLCTQERQH